MAGVSGLFTREFFALAGTGSRPADSLSMGPHLQHGRDRPENHRRELYDAFDNSLSSSERSDIPLVGLRTLLIVSRTKPNRWTATA
jgi:hypothetical protein